MSPEVINYLGNVAVGIILVACFLSLAVIIGMYLKKNREDLERAQGCLKTKVPEGEDQKVCLKDEYAASMVSPYIQEPEEECPECPPCSCALHGTHPTEIFKRLRNVVEDFTMESTLHEGSRFEVGKAAAFADAATRLREVLDELEGKDKNPG